MNRKGQILVLFVVLIPVLLIFATFVIDMSQALYKSNELNHLTKEVIKYGLKNINDEDVRNQMMTLINKNNSKVIEYNIMIDDNKIIMKLKTSSESMFGKAIGIKTYYIKSNYIGYITDEGKMVIEKG
ncbi:MAG: pilus assembly protein TadG-related protein [Bacilli bacterium]|nr:pilus assembly protein TadG-related protein [Bacilli bacterium]